MTIFHAAQNTDQRALFDELRGAEEKSSGKIRYVSVVGQAKEGEQRGVDFDAVGRITPDLIRETLPLDDYDYYLCGPPPFMQAIYDTLRDLGAADARIFAETFGPAALTRHPDGASLKTEPEADLTLIKFEASGFEQSWEKGDATLLETAEAHGLSPAFSCRSGSCGSCMVKKISGDIVYRTPVTAQHSEDEVLICCAVPAIGTSKLVLDL